MRAGTICKLKIECLSNKAGTLGVVYFDYGDGFQVIFKNGKYDGFSVLADSLLMGQLRTKDATTEAEHFLEEVGFEESLAGYHFKNVMQVGADYKKGLFDIAWSEKWEKPFDVCEELRCLAKRQPKDETVLLPVVKPSLWRDSTVDCEFEAVEISQLLQFIADMIE